MRNGAIGRSISAGLLLLAPFVLFGLLVPPTPETPYSDDFDYAATAWHLADTGVLRFSDWPSMTLAAHACWGAVFCKVGGNSYLMLRLSMFVLSAMTSIVLYLWSRRLGHSRAFAVWCGVTFALHPLTVSLQYSFMTDLTGAALGCLLVSLGTSVLNSSRPRSELQFGMLGGVAYLTRQTAAIPVVISIAIAAWQFIRRKARIRKLFNIVAPFAILVIGYRIWLVNGQGVPANQRLQLLQFGGLTAHAARLVAVLFGLGVHLAPVAVVVAVSVWPARHLRLWLGIATAVMLSLATALVTSTSWPTQFLGDVFDLGLHAIEFPVNATPAQLRGPAWRFDGREISVFQLVLIAVSAFTLLILVPTGLTQVGSWRARQRPSLATLSFLANSGLLLVTSLYAERYLLPLIPLSLMILGEQVDVARASKAPTLWMAWLATLVMGFFSLVGIQDGMQRTATFWETARTLHSLGVKPIQVDAGLSYGGQFRYSPMYRGPDHIGPYFDLLSPKEQQFFMAGYSPHTIAASRPVGISFGEIENCRVVARRPFRSWFRSGDVRVLLRNGIPSTELPQAFLDWVAEQRSSNPP